MPLFDIVDGKAKVTKKASVRRKKKVVPELTPIQELIKRRRWQMIMHSAIYYRLDTNIISDHTWQSWADELAELQNANPNQCNIGVFDYEFKDWDGSTGMHLPMTPAIQQKAEWLIELHEKFS